jgi:hypothetical protein
MLLPLPRLKDYFLPYSKPPQLLLH